MSLFDCLETAATAGEMDAARARQAQVVYAGLFQRFRGGMGDAAAQAKAAAETRRIMAADLEEARRRRLLEVTTAQQIDADLATFANKDRPDLAVSALVDRHEQAPYFSVVQRRQSLLSSYHAQIAEFLRRGRVRLMGRPGDPEWVERVGREVLGEDTGDASAKEAARALAETMELARQNFNAAGGKIGRIEGGYLPQHHDSLRVRQVSEADWKAAVRPLLNIDRMKQRVADGVFGVERAATDLDRAIEDGLSATYRSIVNEGWDKVEPSGTPMGQALAAQHADRRFLIFKDADAHFAYQKQFGRDTFDAVLGHLETLATDTALLQRFGPNPTRTIERLKQRVFKEAAARDAAAGGSRHMEAARAAMKLTDDMMGLYTGETNQPVGGTVPRFFMAMRSILQSAQLGSAAISALADLNFARMAASDAGMSTMKLMRGLTRMLDPRNADDRMLAAQSALGAESWATMASGLARYTGEVDGPAWARALADTVMRVSGLSGWTQVGRWNFGIEMMGLLARSARQPFDALPPPLQRTLSRYGLDAAAWERIRGAAQHEHKGVRLLRPDEIAGVDRQLGLRVLEMIQGETEFAVPSTSLRGRAKVLSNLQKGTIPGELIRSTLMYKNFALTLWQTHLMRLWLRPDWSDRAGDAVNLLVGSMLMGALSMQLKQIAAGRDPREVDTPAFWGAALLQGGGLGIFGDFFFSDINRYGGGLETTLAGPVVGFGGDVINLTAGNVLEAVQGEDTNAGRELTRFLRGYTPGSSLWYARLALDRLVWDQLQWLADPKAGAAFRRKEQFWRREYGQRHFWRPGRTLPSRGPELMGVGG